MRLAALEAENDRLRPAPMEVHNMAEGEMRAEVASLRHRIAELSTAPVVSALADVSGRGDSTDLVFLNSEVTTLARQLDAARHDLPRATSGRDSMAREYEACRE
eukprot:562656-Alexandrium_andersonii.AAC.1